MIAEVFLGHVLKAGSIGNPVTVDLWPPSRRARKITHDPAVKDYYFVVRVKSDASSVSILINKVEDINLSFIRAEGDFFEYVSPRISSKVFLGFNLGIIELDAVIDGRLFLLTTLNNISSGCDHARLSYVYSCVSMSPYFILFVDSYTRANAFASIHDDHRKHFWLSIINIKKLLLELNRMISEDNEFISTIKRNTSICKYSARSQVEQEDIEWLTNNPDQLSFSPSGDLFLSGIGYDINLISQTHLVSSYDTYENELILSCLHSMRDGLLGIIDDHHGDELFPLDSLIGIVYDLESVSSYIARELNIKGPYDANPSAASRLFMDPRYASISSLISNWYSNNDLRHGDQILAPTLGFTTIFEYYCIIKIVEALESLGFIVLDCPDPALDSGFHIIMGRQSDRINLMYEPCIRRDSSEFAYTSKRDTSYLRPDIYISYKTKDSFRCGIIDAKFSRLDIVRSKLGPEIYYKYGLYIHSQDGRNMDFVFAMVPSPSDDSILEYGRHDDHAASTSPSLGIISLPFSGSAKVNISRHLSSILALSVVS